MKLKRMVFATVIATMATTAMAAGYTGPDIVADQVMDDGGKGKVYQSKRGMRMETSSPVGTMTSVLDMKTGKCWLAVDSKKIYSVGKITSDGDCTANLNMGMASGESFGGLLSQQPCDGFDLKKQLGEENHQGRPVQKWVCGHSATQTHGMHWYDTKLRLVVKDELNGMKSELVNIKQKPVSAAMFSLPRGYKKVSKNQLMQTMMGEAMQQMMGGFKQQ